MNNKQEEIIKTLEAHLGTIIIHKLCVEKLKLQPQEIVHEEIKESPKVSIVL